MTKLIAALNLILILNGCTGSKLGSGGLVQPVPAAPQPTLAQAIAAGGIVMLPTGVTQVDCNSRLVINKDTKLEGTGTGTVIWYTQLTKML